MEAPALSPTQAQTGLFLVTQPHGGCHCKMGGAKNECFRARVKCYCMPLVGILNPFAVRYYDTCQIAPYPVCLKNFVAPLLELFDKKMYATSSSLFDSSFHQVSEKYGVCSNIFSIFQQIGQKIWGWPFFKMIFPKKLAWKGSTWCKWLKVVCLSSTTSRLALILSWRFDAV